MVTVLCLFVIALAYAGVGALSPASRRRREARGLRRILRQDIAAGARSGRDPAVQGVLAWTDTVAASGRPIRL